MTVFWMKKRHFSNFDRSSDIIQWNSNTSNMFILSPSSRCSFLPCIVVETSKANTSRNKEVFMLSLIFRGYLRNAFLFNCKYQRKIMKLKVYTMFSIKRHINLGKEIKRYSLPAMPSYPGLWFSFVIRKDDWMIKVKCCLYILFTTTISLVEQQLNIN